MVQEDSLDMKRLIKMQWTLDGSQDSMQRVVGDFKKVRKGLTYMPYICSSCPTMGYCQSPAITSQQKQCGRCVMSIVVECVMFVLCVMS